MNRLKFSLLIFLLGFLIITTAGFRGCPWKEKDMEMMTGSSIPPIEPTGLTIQVLSSSQMELTWTDNSDNEQGFKIEVSLDGTYWTVLATVGPNSTSYLISNLDASTSYYYQVRSFNAKGFTPYSKVVSGTTLDAAPAVPILLVPTDNDSDQSPTLTLDWSDPHGTKPITYTLQVDNNNNFSSPEVNQTYFSVRACLVGRQAESRT